MPAKTKLKLPTVRRMDSLYAKLGGKAAVEAVVDEFYEKVLADPELATFFVTTNMTWLKQRQVQFFTQVLGGPAIYKGRPMSAAHEHLPIEGRHFARVVKHLIDSLKSLRVPKNLIDEVAALIAPLKGEIVNTIPNSAAPPQQGEEEMATSVAQTQSVALQTRAMVENAPINIMVADRELRIQYLNPASEKTLKAIEHLLPCKVEEVVGQSIDIFHKNPAHQRRLLANDKNLPHRATIQLGPENLELLVNGLYDDDKNFVGSMVTWEVVTEKLRLKQDMAGQVAAIGKSQAVIEFNMDGTVITANDNFLKVMGYTLDDVKGHHHGMFVEEAYQQSADYKEFWAKLNRGEYQAGEYKRIGKGGKEIWLQASYNPIQDLNGKPFKVVKYATDITGQKHATEDLKRKVDSILKVVSAAAEGDLTHEITVGGQDAIGRMGEGLARFFKDLRGSVSAIAESAQSLANASEELSSTSQQMSANAEETTAQANTVSAATEQVSRNLQTVATGAEEMSATIKDIAKNAGEAAKVASDAVKKAQTTNAIVSKLGDSSAEIGQVIKVITSIAQQTNLLALNATIEAARAGEAGKGFAVVANEVKELAKQTAKATEDISQKINAIQDDTKGAVEAIATISETINQINDISNTIATAVEEQSATTNEMSRNVMEAAKGSEAITQNVSGMAQASQSTSHGAADSLKAAQELAAMASNLRTLVSRFKN